MKEFALKHPWMTFFLVDAVVVNVCKVIIILTGHEPSQSAHETGSTSDTAEEGVKIE